MTSFDDDCHPAKDKDTQNTRTFSWSEGLWTRQKDLQSFCSPRVQIVQSTASSMRKCSWCGKTPVKNVRRYEDAKERLPISNLNEESLH